jgi:hypothetical protein
MPCDYLACVLPIHDRLPELSTEKSPRKKTGELYHSGRVRRNIPMRDINPYRIEDLW